MTGLVQLRYWLKKSETAKKVVLAVNDKLPLAVKDTLFRRLVNPYSEAEDKNHIIFIHVPKTAGNSIFQALFDASPQGHKEALSYQNFDAIRFDKYYKFGFVRNPWDRFVSAYFYLKRGGIGRYDGDFRDKYLSRTQCFGDFIEAMKNDHVYRDNVMSWIHFKPQTSFLCDHKGELMVDYVGRYENIDQCYEELKSNLALESRGELKAVNQSVRDDYRKYYSVSGVDFIRSLYDRDISMFSYEF